MTRKSPYKHKVHTHTRNGTPVRSYTRGHGRQSRSTMRRIAKQPTFIATLHDKTSIPLYSSTIRLAIHDIKDIRSKDIFIYPEPGVTTID